MLALVNKREAYEVCPNGYDGFYDYVSDVITCGWLVTDDYALNVNQIVKFELVTEDEEEVSAHSEG